MTTDSNPTPTPVGEPAIVQKFREGRNLFADYEVSPVERNSILNYIDRLASGTGSPVAPTPESRLAGVMLERLKALPLSLTKQADRELAKDIFERATNYYLSHYDAHWNGDMRLMLISPFDVRWTREMDMTEAERICGKNIIHIRAVLNLLARVGYTLGLGGILARDSKWNEEELIAALHGVVSERDSLRSDLATAKRELEEERTAHEITRTEFGQLSESFIADQNKMAEMTKELESARSQPAVPTGERPSDEELAAVAMSCDCTTSARRALVDAVVARGEAKKAGTMAKLDALASSLKANLRHGAGIFVADILAEVEAAIESLQPAEPKADPPGWTDGTLNESAFTPVRHVLGVGLVEEPKAEPVCGNNPSESPKGSLPERLPAGSKLKSGASVEGWVLYDQISRRYHDGMGVNSIGAADIDWSTASQQVERLTREEPLPLKCAACGAMLELGGRMSEFQWVVGHICSPRIEKLSRAETESATGEGKAEEPLIKAQEIWNDMYMPTLERVERVTGLLLDHLGAWKLARDRRGGGR